MLPQLNSPKEERLWLLQLQKDLEADRAAEKTQADPIYYAIHDYEELVTAEGHNDYIAFYNTDDCESYTEQSVFELFDQDGIQDLLDLDAIVRTDKGLEISDTMDFLDWLSDHHDELSVVYMVSHPKIVPDTLFLTRMDADEHLRANRHHYTEYATSYAMTGWRSPRYEHLMALLRNIDFEKSTLVLKEPKDPA